MSIKIRYKKFKTFYLKHILKKNLKKIWASKERVSSITEDDFLIIYL